MGSARSIVFTAWEAYGEVSGRLLEATFSKLRLQTLEESWEHFLQIFGGALWDSLRVHFGLKKSDLFSGSDFSINTP